MYFLENKISTLENNYIMHASSNFSDLYTGSQLKRQ